MTSPLEGEISSKLVMLYVNFPFKGKTELAKLTLDGVQFNPTNPTLFFKPKY
jgi:hypothetical protein